MDDPRFPKEELFQIARERGPSLLNGINLPEALFDAARGGDRFSGKHFVYAYNVSWGEQVIRLVIEAGVDIKHPQFPLEAVFQVARDHGNSEVVALLEEKGADIERLSKLPITPLADSYRPERMESFFEGMPS